VQNNPISFFDPNGEKIEITGHRVGLVGPYHTAIRFTPDNQQLYAGNPYFRNVDRTGKHYITLSAGPSAGTGGYLTKAINKDTDLGKQAFNSGPLAMPKQKSEDRVFSEIFRNFSNYKNNLFYSLFPVGAGTVFDPDYNSNSFTARLIDSVGFDKSKLSIVPFGWEVPVPQKEFALPPQYINIQNPSERSASETQ